MMLSNMKNVEKLKILAKTYASARDIQQLCSISKAKANSIITELYKGENERYRQVPMSIVIKALGINEARIIKYARLEKEGII